MEPYVLLIFVLAWLVLELIDLAVTDPPAPRGARKRPLKIVVVVLAIVVILLHVGLRALLP